MSDDTNVEEEGAESVEEGEGEDEEESLTSQVKALTEAVALLPVFLAAPFISVLPASWRVYHKLTEWSAYRMQRAAGAQTLANVRRSSGHEDILPARWVEGGEAEKDRTGWRIKGLGDKRYDGAVHGRSTTRFGKANMIHVNEDDTEQATWAEATIDTAFQLDREQYLFRDASVEMVLSGEQPAAGATEAVADGGIAQNPLQVQDVSIEKPGVLHDTLVPVSSRNGYDGQVISWVQQATLKTEQSDQETIRNAKNSSWTAAKLDTEKGADLLKWFLILGAVGLILLFHAEIGAMIAGFGGSGGSSPVPSGIGMIHTGGLLGGF